VQASLANLFEGKWQIANQDNVVAAFHVWAGIAKLVYVKLNAGSITEAVAFVVALDRFNFNAAFDARHALKCFFDNVGF
jgi:hypothetical protein